jgi:hypothetical protein
VTTAQAIVKYFGHLDGFLAVNPFGNGVERWVCNCPICGAVLTLKPSGPEHIRLSCALQCSPHDIAASAILPLAKIAF